MFIQLDDVTLDRIINEIIGEDDTNNSYPYFTLTQLQARNNLRTEQRSRIADALTNT